MASARGVATLLNSMAILLLSSARYGEAAEKAREAFDAAREHQLDALAAYALQHLVAIAAQRTRGVAEYNSVHARAARIFGFVDARLAVMGSVRQQANRLEYERTHAALRDALGADALANLMATG
ncbi:MAG: hypothetical protein WBE83_05430 [Candidatus Cybelea sp.]|jgi:hypothetical protein